mgnify:CR=1 FL=1
MPAPGEDSRLAPDALPGNSGPPGRPAPALTAARTPPWPCASQNLVRQARRLLLGDFRPRSGKPGAGHGRGLRDRAGGRDSRAPGMGTEGTEPAPGADAAEPVSAAEAAPEPVSAPGTEAVRRGEPESADSEKSETASGSESGAGEEPEELAEDEDMDEAAPAGGASSLRTRSYADVLAEQGDYDTALAIYSELAASAAPADREADEKRVAELKRLKQASQAGRQPQNDETVTPETKNDPDPKMISLIDALARRCDARARS